MHKVAKCYVHIARFTTFTKYISHFLDVWWLHWTLYQNCACSDLVILSVIYCKLLITYCTLTFLNSTVNKCTSQSVICNKLSLLIGSPLLSAPEYIYLTQDDATKYNRKMSMTDKWVLSKNKSLDVQGRAYLLMLCKYCSTLYFYIISIWPRVWSPRIIYW